MRGIYVQVVLISSSAHHAVMCDVCLCIVSCELHVIYAMSCVATGGAPKLDPNALSGLIKTAWFKAQGAQTQLELAVVYMEMKNVQNVVIELLVTSPTNHLAVNTNPYNSKRTGYV